VGARWLPQLIVADGEAIRKQLPPSVQRRASVVHNGVDTSIFHPGVERAGVRCELGIPQDHLVIGHAGRITPWKGQHYLIEAFARVCKDNPNVTLLLAGSPIFDNDAYEQRLRKMASESGLQERIKFSIYRHGLPHVLAAMDIFAFTSIEKDTSPLALLSALSTGLPIVAFDIEGVRELTDNDNELLLVPAGNTDHLARSLAKLIADEHLRAQLGQAARRLAKRKFSLEKYVSGIESVLLKARSLSLNSTAADAEDVAEERGGTLSSATSA
jgi:glycosyltransferase involved in cell wall biosynthesis